MIRFQTCLVLIIYDKGDYLKVSFEVCTALSFSKVLAALHLEFSEQFKFLYNINYQKPNLICFERIL